MLVQLVNLKLDDGTEVIGIIPATANDELFDLSAYAVSPYMEIAGDMSIEAVFNRARKFERNIIYKIH